MTGMSISDRVALARFVASTRLGHWLAKTYRNPLYRWRFAHRPPEKLVVAPQDLRTGDPTFTTDVATGVMMLSGTRIDIGGISPFAFEDAPEEWKSDLHSFEWLRDLRAAGSKEARAQATALLDDWMTHHGKPDEIAWVPELISRRLISWLCHSPFLLDEADHALYRRFLTSITYQARYLRHAAADLPDGLPRLQAGIALTYVGLCLSGFSRFLALATRWLDDELKRQILPDGGLISRDPGALLNILLDLLPLRQTFTARAIQPPESLITGIDRMLPMLRFFRHSDGAVANFNGAEPFFPERLATVFAYDDTRGTPVTNAPHSGYQRLQGGDTVLIMDTGKPPPLSVSTKAHASCLAFEFSSKNSRVVVNCGRPQVQVEDWQEVARATAAHSTVCIDGQSSCVFASDEWVTNSVGIPIASGPSDVSVQRKDSPLELSVQASHDGYLRDYGIIHQRKIIMAEDGTFLSGDDRLLAKSQGAKIGANKYAIRFHLHPGVRAVSLGLNEVLLVTQGGGTWLFETPATQLSLEDSVYLADARGARRTKQIVIANVGRSQPEARWSFRLITDELELNQLAEAVEALSEAGEPARG